MRLKDYRAAQRARVVECAISATRNSLKSQVARDFKSPHLATLVPSPRSCRGGRARHGSSPRPCTRSPIAVSFIEGFRTPAPVQAASSPWAVIRNLTQSRRIRSRLNVQTLPIRFETGRKFQAWSSAAECRADARPAAFPQRAPSNRWLAPCQSRTQPRMKRRT